MQSLGAVERVRRVMGVEMHAAGQDRFALADYVWRLRQRFFPLGSQRYERYKLIRRTIERAVHLAKSLPRHVQTGKVRSAPRYLRAKLLAWRAFSQAGVPWHGSQAA